MSAAQDADELRIKSLLIRQGVGPDADPSPPDPPRPDVRPRDWLDDILDEQPAVKPKAKKQRPEQGETGEETEPDEDEETDGKGPPGWDPTVIADRIVHAYQQRTVGERLKHAADVVVHSRARFGQLFYTASGVWAAWRIGLTPWLLHFTADAPIGIPVLFLGVGWLVNRRFDPGPLLIAWVGRAAYTATVINLVLHP